MLSIALAHRTIDIPRVVERLLGNTIERFEILKGGANNIVGRADTKRESFAVKAYFHDPHDGRDRLGTEYSILSFLWKHGIRCIPEPVAADWNDKVGIYAFVNGTKARPGSLTKLDVLSMSDFLNEMWSLRNVPGASSLPVASDACFSLSDYIGAIEIRLKNLKDNIVGDRCGKAAIRFLEDDFCEVFYDVKRILQSNNNYHAVLPLSERTLSPSDHGFHNAIKDLNHKWVFIDFEYAGWDDPAKMVADACHQPAVPIHGELRRSFFQDILQKIDHSGSFASRVKGIYPAVGLKWCMILLSEFIPVTLRRRQFSGQDDKDSERHWLQLKKAKQKLEKVRQDLEYADIF